MIHFEPDERYEEGRDFIDSIITISVEERNQMGYRENLCYDRASDVSDKLGELRLGFRERTSLMKYFHDQM